MVWCLDEVSLQEVHGTIKDASEGEQKALLEQAAMFMGVHENERLAALRLLIVITYSNLSLSSVDSYFGKKRMLTKFKFKLSSGSDDSYFGKKRMLEKFRATHNICSCRTGPKLVSKFMVHFECPKNPVSWRQHGW